MKDGDRGVTGKEIMADWQLEVECERRKKELKGVEDVRREFIKTMFKSTAYAGRKQSVHMNLADRTHTVIDRREPKISQFQTYI